MGAACGYKAFRKLNLEFGTLWSTVSSKDMQVIALLEGKEVLEKWVHQQDSKACPRLASRGVRAPALCLGLSD